MLATLSRVQKFSNDIKNLSKKLECSITNVNGILKKTTILLILEEGKNSFAPLLWNVNTMF